MFNQEGEGIGRVASPHDLEELDPDVGGHRVFLIAGELGDQLVEVDSATLGEQQALVDGFPVAFGLEGLGLAEENLRFFLGGGEFSDALFRHLGEEPVDGLRALVHSGFSEDDDTRNDDGCHQNGCDGELDGGADPALGGLGATRDEGGGTGSGIRARGCSEGNGISRGRCGRGCAKADLSGRCPCCRCGG